MKLELKHLAHYLPYKLNCYAQGEVEEGTEYDDKPIPKRLTIVGADETWATVEGIRITVDENIYIEDCIPLLRSLNQLDEEIEHNGEKFIPIDWLEEKYYTLSLHKECERLLDEDGFMWINQSSHLLVLHLLEWHFDIYGLIEEKLAMELV